MFSNKKNKNSDNRKNKKNKKNINKISSDIEETTDLDIAYSVYFKDDFGKNEKKILGVNSEENNKKNLVSDNSEDTTNKNFFRRSSFNKR